MNTKIFSFMRVPALLLAIITLLLPALSEAGDGVYSYRGHYYRDRHSHDKQLHYYGRHPRYNKYPQIYGDRDWDLSYYYRHSGPPRNYDGNRYDDGRGYNNRYYPRY